MPLTEGERRPVIAGQYLPAYRASMQLVLARLLTVLALVLMPFGMGTAPVAAQPAQHHSAAAAAHCPDPASDESATDRTADCTMTCSVVVAPDSIAVPPPAAATPPPARALAERGSGLHPEAAIPPPKRA